MQLEGQYCEGRLDVKVGQVEMRMSHTVFPPAITLVATGECCLDLMDTLWDLYHLKDNGDELVLTLREYPGDRPSTIVSVSAANGGLTYNGMVLDQAQLLREMDKR